MKKIRIGVLGGTFDPIHYAHLRLAEEAVEILSLDRMLMILSATPPHKDAREVTPFEIRWEMLQTACRGNPRLEPSDLERERTGPSYTIDTLKEIRNRFGSEVEIFLTMGMDCAVEFTTWKDYGEILSTAAVSVFTRQGESRSQVPESVRDRMTFLEWEGLRGSSTAIRKLVAEGRSIRYLLPPEVETIVSRNSLYRMSEPVRQDGNGSHTPGEVFA